MISNRIISLHPESAERIDAVNTNKIYTFTGLYLPRNLITRKLSLKISLNIAELVVLVFMKANLLLVILNIIFFGRPGLENQYGLLQHLDYEAFSKSNKTFEQYSSLSDMILQHCVLSSYHALITDLFSEQTLTSYSFS